MTTKPIESSLDLKMLPLLLLLLLPMLTTCYDEQKVTDHFKMIDQNSDNAISAE